MKVLYHKSLKKSIIDFLELLKGIKSRIEKAALVPFESTESFESDTLEMTTWIDKLIQVKVAGRSAEYKTSFNSMLLTAGPNNDDTTTNVVRFEGSDSGGSGELMIAGDLLARNKKIIARITNCLAGLRNGAYTFTFEPSLEKSFIQKTTDTYFVYPSNYEEAK